MNNEMEKSQTNDFKQKESLKKESSFRKITKMFRFSKRNIESEIIPNPEFLIESNLEKKQKAFNFLKNWDENRVLLLNIHKNITKFTLIQLFLKADEIISQNDLIIRFFKDRSIQDKRYSEMLYNEKIRQNDSINTITKSVEMKNQEISINGEENVILTLENLMEEQYRKIGDFSKFVDENIVKELLEDNYKKYVSFVENSRISFQKQIKKINKLSIELNESYQYFSVLFSEMMKCYISGETWTNNVYFTFFS